MAGGSQYTRFILGSEKVFELEKEIKNWKEALVDDGAINAEERRELESHLRESITALHSKGLNEQEAFFVATNRLGPPSDLQQEFAKNNLAGRWRYRLFWMLVGFLSLRAAGSTVAAITKVMGVVMAFSGLSGSISGIALLVITVTFWIGIFTIGFRKRQRLGWSGEGLPLTWVVALGAVLVIAPVVSTCGLLVQSRLVDASWFGEAALYSAYGGFALNLLIVALCFTILLKLNDRDALTLN